MLADIQRRGGEITAIEVSQAAQIGDPASVAILTEALELLRTRRANGEVIY